MPIFVIGGGYMRDWKNASKQDVEAMTIDEANKYEEMILYEV